MLTAHCETCMHLCNRNDDKQFGQCARFPPTPLIVGVGLAPGDTLKLNAQPQPLIQATFPTVGYDQLCGEYAPLAHGEA